MKKYQLAIIGLFLVGIVAAGAFAFGMNAPLSDSAKQALSSDDFTAFKAATNTSMSQAQFDKMSQRYTQGATRNTAMQSAQTAIADNDFNAWVAAMTPVSKDASTLTQDTFNKLVQQYQDRQAVQNAIKNDDFAAWKTAMSASSKDPSKLTQDVFDGLVQNYQADQKIQAAITANDYAAWKQAMLDKESAQLTQTAFQQAVQHPGPQSGLMGPPMGFGHGMRGQMKSGFGAHAQ